MAVCILLGCLPTAKAETVIDGFFIGEYKMVTRELLMSLFNYDCTTGIFTHTERRSGVVFGSVAGSLNADGYVHISVYKRKYPAHVLAWIYVYGIHPKDEIDHIDGVRNNNRISNLRAATRLQNQQYISKIQTNNKSGVRGVCWNKQKNKWMASISSKGKSIHIGYYQTLEQAHMAYVETKRSIHSGSTI